MTNCYKNHNQPDHSKNLPRLNRIIGQIEGLKKMVEERRYCPDILVQLKAVRSALKSVEANILEQHLHGCVTGIIQSGTAQQKAEKITEIKDLFRKYEE